MVYFTQICLHIHIYIVWPLTGIQNGDEASPSISQASCGQLVKMLITLEPNLYILTLSSHCYENGKEALQSISLAGRGL